MDRQMTSYRPEKVYSRRLCRYNGGKRFLPVDETTRLRRIEYLLGTLLSLVVADGLISQFLIKNGLGHEGNPLIRVLVTENNFLVIKMCAAIICVIILWNIARRLPRLIFIFSACLVGLYTALLLWNISVFLVFGL
jgi:hypothetical protein